jgi:hypothetical protein
MISTFCLCVHSGYIINMRLTWDWSLLGFDALLGPSRLASPETPLCGPQVLQCLLPVQNANFGMKLTSLELATCNTVDYRTLANSNNLYNFYNFSSCRIFVVKIFWTELWFLFLLKWTVDVFYFCVHIQSEQGKV